MGLLLSFGNKTVLLASKATILYILDETCIPEPGIFSTLKQATSEWSRMKLILINLTIVFYNIIL